MLLVLNGLVYGQKIRLSGYVTELNSGERLIGAVIVDSRTNTAVYTNNYGFYSLILNKNDSLNIQCSYIGYSVYKKSFVITENTTLNIELEKGVVLDSVVICSNNQILKNDQIGTIYLNIAEIKKTPSLGGENDIFHVLQMMPGVQSGVEGSSGLFVRGGNLGQNMILIDDVPLYYVSHMGGFVSIFNANAINKIKLIKGNFPASYGGRISSVLDVRLKDGNLKKIHTNLTIGLLTSKLMIEGPLFKNKSSFLISARAMLWGQLYAIFSKYVFKVYKINYNFYDLNMKFNYHINNKNVVFFSFYNGDDNFIPKSINTDNDNSQKMEMPIHWGNLSFAFRWNHILNSSVFSNLTIYYTRYRYMRSFIYEDLYLKDKMIQTNYSGINDFAIKYDLQMFISKNYSIKTGIINLNHNFIPSRLNIFEQENDSVILDTIIGNRKFKAYEINIYMENIFKIGQIFVFNIGFRFSNYLQNQTFLPYLSPRFLMNVKLNSKTSLKFAATKTIQNVHLLMGNTVNFPVNLWMPATQIALPEKANQFSISLFKKLNKNISFSVETYYKKMHDLISLSEGRDLMNFSENWENKIETKGIGTAYGMEILINKKNGKITGWISYSYARSFRQFKNINFGEKYPFKYDRIHNFNINTSYKINKNISISASWVYGSGFPFTLSIGKYSVFNNMQNLNDYNNNELAYIYPEKNSYRMKDFHHLDFAVNFSKKKKNLFRIWTFGVYNVYNRQNPFYYYLQQDENKKWHLMQQSLFPIIPSISYSIKF